jgi:predicted cobalt transporter CbtA
MTQGTRSACPATEPLGMRFTQLLRHGIIAGAAAGLCAALVLWLVVEPVIRRALLIEGAREHQHDGHVHETLVSRPVQVFTGAVTAVLVGVLVGLVFAVVFAWARHRLPGSTDLGRAGTLATAGFTAITLVPALKLPANPPAVGDPATVTDRTLLYLLTILLGLLAVALVMTADRRLSDRRVGAPLRIAVTTGLAVGSAVAILALMPGSPDSVPPDVPATLLWDFRVASLAQLATMWLVLGLVFGVLVDSRSGSPRAAAPVTTDPASA